MSIEKIRQARAKIYESLDSGPYGSPPGYRQLLEATRLLNEVIDAEREPDRWPGLESNWMQHTIGHQNSYWFGHQGEPALVTKGSVLGLFDRAIDDCFKGRRIYYAQFECNREPGSPIKGIIAPVPAGMEKKPENL